GAGGRADGAGPGQNGASSSSAGAAGSRANGSHARFACPLVAAGGGPAVSESRVAHAGNGNSTASGTGISGCETNIVPGLASVARCRCDGGRNPYSGRPASAGSSRPTTFTEELDTIRRSTSLAVCCAP